MRVNLKMFIKYIFMLTIIITFSICSALYSQTNNDIAINGPTSSNSKFIVDMELATYLRFSEVVEQTGNEDTLGVLLKGRMQYVKHYKYASVEANLKGQIYEPLSHKARFYEDMSPPLFDFNVLNIAAVMKYGTVRLGVLESYTKNIPMTTYFPSLFYIHTVSSNKATILSGPRDLPIGYNSQLIPDYDTGIMGEFLFYGFFIGVGVINGEMGLDANSSKGLMAKISWSNNTLNFGASGIITEIGSIPIKEWGDSVNVFFYSKLGKRKNITLGAEMFWFRHGIRRLNEYSGGEDNDNEFNYNDGYYTDFSIQTFGGKPYYAMSGFIFFEALNLWKFDILTHIGVHDNNIYSQSGDLFEPKYRAFLRITFNITDDLKILLSDTFTYDPVYRDNYQYYELERRYQLGAISYKAADGGHYTVDNDLYLGLVFRFGNI